MTAKAPSFGDWPAARPHQEALELDPGFALALAELSRAYQREAGDWVPVAESLRRTQEAAEQALSLEPIIEENR